MLRIEQAMIKKSSIQQDSKTLLGSMLPSGSFYILKQDFLRIKSD